MLVPTSWCELGACVARLVQQRPMNIIALLKRSHVKFNLKISPAWTCEDVSPGNWFDSELDAWRSGVRYG